MYTVNTLFYLGRHFYCFFYLSGWAKTNNKIFPVSHYNINSILASFGSKCYFRRKENPLAYLELTDKSIPDKITHFKVKLFSQLICP